MQVSVDEIRARNEELEEMRDLLYEDEGYLKSGVEVSHPGRNNQ